MSTVGFIKKNDFNFSASSDCVARLWNVEDAEVKREYTGHTKAVVSLAFNDGF